MPWLQIQVEDRRAVNIKDIIRADKTDLNTGAWATGHVPRTAFPMSKVKDRKYKYGQEYRWRVVKFTCLGVKCRILILLNLAKQILRARLGVESGPDMIVLCDHEFHASEPGWHCHVTFEEAASVPPGAARQDKMKWPKNIRVSERFTADEASALSIVAATFRFKEQGELI